MWLLNLAVTYTGFVFSNFSLLPQSCWSLHWIVVLQRLVHNTVLSVSCSFLWVVVRDSWCRAWAIKAVRLGHRALVEGHLARLEFSWHSPRSAPLLIRALVKKAGSDGLPLLSFGSCCKAEVLLLALPILLAALQQLYLWWSCTDTALIQTQACWLAFLAWYQMCSSTAYLLCDHWTGSDWSHLLPSSWPGAANFCPNSVLVRSVLEPSLLALFVPSFLCLAEPPALTAPWQQRWGSVIKLQLKNGSQGKWGARPCFWLSSQQLLSVTELILNSAG